MHCKHFPDRFRLSSEPLAAALGVQVQGYLAHKKQRPPRTLQQEYA